MSDSPLNRITLNRNQLSVLESFFGGNRNRLVSVHQERDSKEVDFLTPPRPARSLCLRAVVTLADVEELCVEADTAPTREIFLVAASE